MKITFVLATANLSGGVRIIAEHARMLHERGHEVTVVSGRKATPGPIERLRRRLACKPPVRPSSASHLDGAPYRVLITEQSPPIDANDLPDADILFATWWETAEWIARAPMSKGIKVNFLQGYEVHPYRPPDRLDAVWSLPWPKIVVSEWLRSIAAERFGDTSAMLVSNGTDTSHFRFSDRGPTDRRIVGSVVTRLSKKNAKRFWLTVDVIHRLRARGVACEFVGFGASEVPESELPSGSRVEIRPSQTRIAEIYASCDCWLFTSEKEGYGLPLLEAMACGTPVVATPAGAAPELLASGGGTLVDSDDPEAIADAVEAILNLDEGSWRAMSRAARAEAEKHSWDLIGDQMEAALLQILSEGR